MKMPVSIFIGISVDIHETKCTPVVVLTIDVLTQVLRSQHFSTVEKVYLQ